MVKLLDNACPIRLTIGFAWGYSQIVIAWNPPTPPGVERAGREHQFTSYSFIQSDICQSNIRYPHSMATLTLSLTLTRYP